MCSDVAYSLSGPSFEKFEELLVIGLKTVFTPTTRHNIAAVWEKFPDVMGTIDNVVTPFPFGVCIGQDDGTDNMAYMAGMSVSNFSFIPRDMSTCVLPAGEYAVFTHSGSLDEFPRTMDHIFKSWLPNAEVNHAGTAELEVYDQRFDPMEMKGEVDYRVPIRR